MDNKNDLDEQTEAMEKLTDRTKDFKQEMESTRKIVNKFADDLMTGLKSALSDGKALQAVMKNLALDLSRSVIESARSSLLDRIDSLFDGPPKLLKTDSNSKSVTAHAKGGIVSTPTMFPMAGGVGLMGEAGAEAILPLARGSDGRLGVRSNGNAAPNVIVNISTPDASSFQKSEDQVSRMMARAVARGQRRL